MATFVREDDDVLSEINITPLVDVMLVLLVSFVVTIPALTNAVHINLPEDGHDDSAGTAEGGHGDGGLGRPRVSRQPGDAVRARCCRSCRA